MAANGRLKQVPFWVLQSPAASRAEFRGHPETNPREPMGCPYVPWSELRRKSRSSKDQTV